MESVFTIPGIFVHLAALCYVLGMLFRDQLILRGLVLLGTAFYITYYYLAADVPLWDAIFWSVMIGSSNLYVMGQIVLERTTFNMTANEKKLYETFSALCPGDFRKLLKITQWKQSDGNTPLVTEGVETENLYFVMDSPCRAQKNKTWFALKNSCFVGEVSYITSGRPTATVVVDSGGRYVVWNRADLEKLEHRTPSIAVALSKIMKTDLASKLATSIGDQLIDVDQRAPKMADPTRTYVAPNSIAVS